MCGKTSVFRQTFKQDQGNVCACGQLPDQCITPTYTPTPTYTHTLNTHTHTHPHTCLGSQHFFVLWHLLVLISLPFACCIFSHFIVSVTV